MSDKSVRSMESQNSTLRESQEPTTHESQNVTVRESRDSTVRVGSRERKPTEKGLQYSCDISEKAFKSMISKWRSCVGRVSVLLSDETDATLIREGRKALESAHGEARLAYLRLFDMYQQVDLETREVVHTFEMIEDDYQNLMCRIADRILDLKANDGEAGSRVSARSVRTGASRRSRATIASRRSDAAAEAAALKTKLKYLDEENRVKLELEKIVTKRQIEMAEAKAQVFDDALVDVDSDPGDRPKVNVPEINKRDLVEQYVQSQASEVGHGSQIGRVDSGSNANAESTPIHQFVQSKLPKTEVSKPLNPFANAFSPLEYIQSSNASPQAANVEPSPTVDGILELTKSLAEQLTLSRLPPPEPGIFNGDPLKYPGWKSAFNTLIEQRKIPPSEKIHYLQKYLGERVRDVVANFFLCGTEDAYSEAKKLLDERFGDPFVISNAFRSKLDKWPRIQSRDASGLRKFADFLKQCHTAMASVGSLGTLDDERENRKLLAKLPDWLVSRWNRIAVQWREEKKASPPFKEFMLFMTKEARIACDPVSSLQSLKSDQVNVGVEKVDFGRSENRTSRKVGSFLSEASHKPAPKVSVNQREKKECALCQRNHEIDTCKEFLSKTVDGRKAFARQKGLCFGCLSSDHVAKFCKQRKTCKVCNHLHPTSLHGDRRDVAKGKEMHTKNSDSKPSSSSQHSVSGCSSTSLMNHSGMGHMSSMILPVYVSHESCPGNERLVYALLDSQSDTTFILEDTCSALGLSGVEVDLLLSTMYAENKLVKSSRISGLKVRGFNESESCSCCVYTANHASRPVSHSFFRNS